MTDPFAIAFQFPRRFLAVLVASAALVGCASTRTAVPQSVTVKSTPMTFGGTYEPRPQDLILSINGDPVLRGTFPPYTPTLTLNATYRGNPVRAECYFATNVSSRVGFVGRIVATSVQSAQGKAGDECKLFVDTVEATTIYF